MEALVYRWFIRNPVPHYTLGNQVHYDNQLEPQLSKTLELLLTSIKELFSNTYYGYFMLLFAVTMTHCHGMYTLCYCVS